MSSGPSSSCWIAWRKSKSSTGQLIAGAIEHTRFPYSPGPDVHDVGEWAALLRAADLVGQLGDPHYLSKANALYHEFEEIGLTRQLGYEIAGGHGRPISAILLGKRISATFRTPSVT